MKKEILSISATQAVEAGILPADRLAPPKAYPFDTLKVLEDGTVLCGGKNVARLTKDQLRAAASMAEGEAMLEDLQENLGAKDEASGPPATAVTPAVTGKVEASIPDVDAGEPPLL